MTTQHFQLLRERIARCQADYRERPIFVCFLGDSNTCGWGNESIQQREASQRA